MMRIPTKSTELSFLLEVDFPKLATMLETDKSIVRPAAREDEIEAMCLSLMSAQANSVWLLGDEGVGKSLIINGLLQKIANREVGPSFLSKRFCVFCSPAFFKLPQAQQLSGFDELLTFLNQRATILVFDRIDDFIDTANSDSNFYANALIDALSDTTQAIITSQLKSREKIHESSTGFAPTFAEQVIKSPDRDGLLYMLRANRMRLETEHDVTIPEETIREAARILARYPGRAFTAPWPQGPVELLDKTAASVRMSCYNLSQDVMRKAERLLQLQNEKSAIESSARPIAKRLAEIGIEIKSLQEIVEPAKANWASVFGPYVDILNEVAKTNSEIAEIDGRQKGPNNSASAEDRRSLNVYMELKASLEKKAKKLANDLHANRAVVSRADLQRVFANASGVTLTDISGDERQRLLGAEAELGKTVFGQTEAINATANVIRDARSGVSDPDRPAGVIMYTGPTGTGKTETAKAVALIDGGEGSKPITFAMNKFKDQSAASEFRGPAPGLIGYNDEGPPGLRKVRQNPRSIVLFDEVEKAHEEMFDVIMTVTDEGVIEDSAGNVVNWKDCILIFTTNVVLPEDITSYMEKNGIEATDDSDAQLVILRDAIKAKINPKTNRPFFKPEFVERLDMLVMFDYLGTDAAKSILHKQIVNQNKTLETKNYRLEIDDATVDSMISKFFSKGGNGRTVRQFYNRLIRPQITSYLLTDSNPPHENEDAKVILVRFDGDVVSIIPQKLILVAKNYEVSQGSGLGQILSLEEGRARLADYAVKE